MTILTKFIPLSPQLSGWSGWIHSIRRHKNVHFIHLKESSITPSIQLVMKPEISKDLTIGSYIRVKGPFLNGEIIVESIDSIGPCPPNKYPLTGIDKNPMKDELLRSSFPHLRIRTSEFAHTLKERAIILGKIRSYLDNSSYTEVQLPSLTYTDCEGGSDTFRVLANTDDMTSKPTYLSVSGQMYLEMASVGLGKVYSIGPCFRAEKTNTRRHMNEFTMLECEIPFIDCIQSLMDQIEDLISSIYPLGKVERITYTEAIISLKDSFPSIQWDSGLKGIHERFLAKLKGGPLFIYNYPASLKPFYMKKNKDNPDTCASFDLIIPNNDIGELAGGGLRAWDENELIHSMKQKEIPSQPYSWYLDLRKYGSSPHGGWGIGIDRLVQLIQNKNNIRDCVLVSRTQHTNIL